MGQYPDDPTALTFVEYDSLDRDTVESFLRDLGADNGTINIAGRHVRHANVRQVMARVTEYARSNPRVVLGALSALVAGGAVAAGAAVKKSSSSKRTAAKKSSSSSRKRSTKSSKSSKSSRSAKSSRSSKAAKRTLIEPHAGDKRYIRRDARGRIKESVDVGRSLSADRRSKSKTKSKPGQGDKGDR
jgi:hypothetical protein